MQSKTKTISIEARVRMFWIFSATIFLSLGVYGYAVLATINHTIAKKNIVEESSALTTRVSELEFAMIGEKNDVNLETALSYGFAEVKNPIYISRISNSLTLNTEGR